MYVGETGREYLLQVEFDRQMPHDGHFVHHGLSAIKSLSATGINNVTDTGSAISVYPNPSRDVFNVGMRQGADQITWEVMDIQENTIFSGSNSSGGFDLDMSTYPKGIYYIKITQGGGLLVVKKLVLQ